MSRSLLVLPLLALTLALHAADSPQPKPTTDWPQWRGPKRDAKAPKRTS